MLIPFESTQQENVNAMSDIWHRALKPSDDVLFQELSGEAVLLNVRTEQYYGLDRVGARIWALIVELGVADAVVMRMLEEFDVGEAELRADVVRLVEELLASRLLVASARSAD